MQTNDILEKAIAYYSEDKKDLLKYLSKISTSIHVVSEQDNKLPLIVLEKNGVYLWIKDEPEGHPYLFSESEDILFIITTILMPYEEFYLAENTLGFLFDEEDVQKEIDKALLENDKNKFYKLIKQLKDK